MYVCVRVAFLVFNSLISVITSSIDTFKNLNFLPVVMFLIASILGCFLYSKIVFRYDCELLSAHGSVSLYSRIFKFVIALNKLFKTVAFLSSLLIIPSPSTRNVLLLGLILPNNRSLIAFQDCLFSAISSSFFCFL